MLGGVFLLFGILAIVAGGFGGFLIAKYLRGIGAFAAFVLWLAAPFVVLNFAFSASVDPTLTPQQASYNVAMATVLTSIMIAIPWFGANLVGLVMGRNRRKARTKVAEVFEGPSAGTAAEPAAPPTASAE